MQYTLENKELKAMFRTKSAELVSLARKKDGRELMWHGDPAYWGWSSPVLFPFVGSVLDKTYRYRGKEYHVNQHGFARNREFKPVSRTETEIVFRLTDCDETREIYPFAFCLDIQYILEGARLSVNWTVKNPAEEKMYFSIGAHPAFLAPLADGEKQSDGYLCFPDVQGDELTYHRIDLSVGGIAPEKYILPVKDGKCRIQEGMFDKDALIFEDRQAKSLGLAGGDGKPYVMLHFDAPLFGVWSPAGKQAPFICLEPWYGRSDAVGFTGSLEEREYEMCLEPQEEFHGGYVMEVM